MESSRRNRFGDVDTVGPPHATGARKVGSSIGSCRAAAGRRRYWLRRAARRAATATITAAALATSGPARCAEPGAASGAPWSFSLTGFYYFPRQDDNFGLVIGQATKGPLLIEARYNYEALDTGSLWVGHTFAGGEALTWEVTPMVGAVFGELTGAAPGANWISISRPSMSSISTARTTVSSTPGANSATVPSSGCGWGWWRSARRSIAATSNSSAGRSFSSRWARQRSGSTPSTRAATIRWRSFRWR